MSDTTGFFEFSSDDTRAGFRLQSLEIYNWGTFHKRVWTLGLGGANALLTGDIGSGKSTLVDALNTLLVPPIRITYNKAAGAERRERDLRSYVQGYYKSERSDEGYAAKPVALRGKNDYTVILAVFFNEGYNQTVSLAQVFWIKDSQSQPHRLYVVADKALSIAGDFANFGSDPGALRKRLRDTDKVDPLFDSYPAYGAAFRRRFGLSSEQALTLFHQTVSMKAVGNLTEFVREHMLEPFNSQERIDALLHHFDDLNRAHEAVLRAKQQIDRLTPLVDNLDRHAQIQATEAQLRHDRDTLRVYFAYLRSDLFEARRISLEKSLASSQLKRAGVQDRLAGYQADRDQIKRDISDNGGDRLETLKKNRGAAEEEKVRRLRRFDEYFSLAQQVDLPGAASPDQFIENRGAIDQRLEDAEKQSAGLNNALTDGAVELRALVEQQRALAEELDSLRRRKSNIDSAQVAIRTRLCTDLGLNENRLPFAGELMQVRPGQEAWEGAAERVLRSFGLSLLVPTEYYAAVSQWVDQTHLRGRLVYYQIPAKAPAGYRIPDDQSLAAKIITKEGHEFSPWIQDQLVSRFDYTCAEDIGEFRLASRAVTQAGQVKGLAQHEKDDRHSIHDRTRYVLGWQNQNKIKVLTEQKTALETAAGEVGVRISGLESQRRTIEEQKKLLYQLRGFSDFSDLDWKPYAATVDELTREISALQKASNILKALNEQLTEVEGAIREADTQLQEIVANLATLSERLQVNTREASENAKLLDGPVPTRAELDGSLGKTVAEVLGAQKITLENSDKSQTAVREVVQRKIDNEVEKMRRLAQNIVGVMTDFRRDYPEKSRDMDASIEGGGEYRALLAQLTSDDLPQFESRFKALLNENTLREIANFQGALNRESQLIKERVDTINRSLEGIEYNKDRYITLEAELTTDPEIRSFRQELRSCTEGSFTGSQDDQYAETKFTQVRSIIDRFRGREGTGELDARWTTKVTDVRNWYTFAASERWRADKSEYEHYTDSGGKSGGQKEKLAYTVLAASLAYQFGLEFGETRSRSFRFVAIDEAFGRGSDESTRFGLELFRRLNLQLLIITPLQKIPIIEPYVSTVGFVHNEGGSNSMLRCLTIEEYREEVARRRKGSAQKEGEGE